MITLCLQQEIPDTHACSLYFSIDPYQCVEFMTAVANQRPSDIIPTFWPLNSDINSLTSIKLIVKLDLIQNIDNQANNKSQYYPQKDFAKKVGMNLYNYMSSFERVNIILLLIIIKQKYKANWDS